MTLRMIFVSTALVMFVVPRARADDATKARALYQQGAQHYDLNEYPQALDLFKEAYRNHEDPAILYNIAQCYRQLGDSESAIRFYRSYMNKSDLPTERQERIREIISRLEAEIQAKKAAATTPPTGLTAPAGASTSEPAAAVAARPQRRSWYQNPAGWSLVAGGAACLAIGGAGVGIAAGEHNQALAATTQTDFDQHHGNSIRDQEWGWPALGVGSALVVAGVAVIAIKAVRR